MFEEPENGIHPWLLNKIVQLLTTISTNGIYGQSVQVLMTTHSLAILDLLTPEQIRIVEMNPEEKTSLHRLPVSSERFKKH